MTRSNTAASVRQRLLNLSRETGEPFQNLLTRYGIERLIYRLSQSARLAGARIRIQVDIGIGDEDERLLRHLHTRARLRV